MSSLRAAVAPVEAADLPRWPLALTRLLIGFLWFQQVLWKLPPDFGCGPQGAGGLCDWINREVQHPAVPLYATFLKQIVLPNFGFFGLNTVLLESAIAVTLFFGILTRLGGLLGVVQSLNLLIGLAAVPGEWYWTYLMLLLLCGLFMFLAPGRTWGLDALIRQRFVEGPRKGTFLGRLVGLAT
jgi:thiosulfate dehydrogenase [quinone] large subunit